MISTTTSQKALNITLIRPPVQELRSNLSPFGAIPPIGLAYIAAALRDVGHHLNVIDAVGESIDEYSELSALPFKSLIFAFILILKFWL